MFQAFKKLIIFASVLTALAYVGNLLIDNPYVHSLIRNVMNEKLNQYTHVSAKFEAINVKFVPLGIDVYGVELRHKKPDGNDQTLAQVAHLRLRFSLQALLLSQPEIFNLEFNEPRIRLPLPPLEELLKKEQFPDWDKPLDLPSWPLQAAMPIKHIKIGNATINFKLPDEKPNAPDLLSMQLEGLDVDFTFSNWQDFELAVQLKRGNFGVQGAELLRDLSLQIKLKQSKDQLISEQLSLESEELGASGRARVVFETEKRKQTGALQGTQRKLKGLLIRIENEINRADVAILGRYLGIDQTQGRIFGKTELQLHIPLDSRSLSWRLDGQGQSDSALLYGFKLLDSKLEFNITDQGMTFEEAHVLRGKRELAQGSGFIGFSKSVPFHFNIHPKHLPFAELMSVLKVDDFKAFSAELDSPGLKLVGEALPFSIRISGPARFSQISLPFVNDLPKRFLEAPTCQLQAGLQINASAVEITKGDGHCWPTAHRDENLSADKGSPVQLGGKFSYTTAEGMDFTFNSKGLDTSIFQHYTKLPAKGAAMVHTRIHGSYDHLLIDGKASGHDLSIGGFEFKQLETAYGLNIESNQLLVTNLHAKLAEQGLIEVERLQMEIGGLYSFNARLKARHIPASFLRGGFIQSFQMSTLAFGFKSIDGMVKGPLLQPFAWDGRLDLSVNDLILDDQNLLSEGSGSIRSDQNNWSLERGYLRLDQLEARTAIHIKKSGTWQDGKSVWQKLGIHTKDRIHISVKTINHNARPYRTNEVTEEVNHLTSLPYVGKFFADQAFGAQIQLDAELEGPIDHLQGKVEGSLEQPYVWGIPISSFTLSGFIDGWKLHIPELRHSGNSLVGRLNLDFGKPSIPYDWYLYFNQMDIRAILGKVFAEDPRNFAYLTAEWTMSGELGNFWASHGDLLLSSVRSKLIRNLGSRTSSVELNSNDPIRLKISPQGWTFADKRPLKLQGEYFDLNFIVGNNRLPDQLDVGVHGSVKLDILKNFSNVVETARGEILIDGYLRGSITKPELSIKLKDKRLDPFNVKDWQPVSVGLVDYGPALTSIAMDVEIKDDRMIVNRFKASKGREGSISMAGQLNFNGDDADASRLKIDLDRLEFNRLAVPILKSADLTLSGHLIVSGHKLPLDLSGDLVVDRLQSIGNFDLRKQIITSLYETKLATASSTDEQSPLLNLDIGVTAEKSITIKNKSLEALISADVHVRGTDAQPILSGQVIADRGTFNYRRTFKINQAVISFEEPSSPPNPRLDIVGEATVSPYKVGVVVNGNLQNPRVQLTVDPPNRDDGSPISNLDILLLISTGRIPEQANKTTAERASLNELVSFFAAFAEEPIEKLFDMSGQTVIREVYFDSYLPESGQRPVTRINFPIRLGEKLNAVLQVDDEANTKVSLEYLIHEGITVSGSLDQSTAKQTNDQKTLPADSGFDLKFRFGFD